METFVLTDGTQLAIREYDGTRVVTFDVVDKLHQKAEGTSRRNFARNQRYFIKNIDYFHFVGQKGKEELQNSNYRILSELEINPDNKHFSYYLLTESGYCLLCKSFKDSLSWDVQRQLLNGYFYAKSNINSIYDALRICINRLEEQDNKMKLISTEQEKQKAHSIYLNDSISDLRKRMETPIADGALTPAQLAAKMGLYSLRKLPHAHIIEDICHVCNINANSRVIRPDTEYVQYRVETKANVQVIQTYLKVPAQELITKWWEENKDKIKTVEYYQKNSGYHLKGEPKIPYYKIYKLKRYIA